MLVRIMFAVLLVVGAGCAKADRATDAPKEVVPPGQRPVVDCSYEFAESQLCLTMTWEVLPTDSTVGSFTFKVTNSDGDPMKFSELPGVVLWMPSMGHGSTPTRVEIASAAGEDEVYRAANVHFVMRGEWQIRFQVKLNGALKEELVVPYTF